MTRSYFLNPFFYIDDLIERGHKHFSWLYGTAKMRSIDPVKFFKLRAGANYEWEGLSIAVEGAAEYDHTSTSLDRPRAVYPSWDATDGIKSLERYCENPVGEDYRYYNNTNIPAHFRPVKFQKHRILVHDFGDTTSIYGKNFFLQFMRVVKKYPDVEFILHGSKSYRILFLPKPFGVVHNPEYFAKKGNVFLPNGHIVEGSKNLSSKHVPWLRALGWHASQLQANARNITRFNIDSMLWAAKYFAKDAEFTYKQYTSERTGLDVEELAEDDEFIEAMQFDIFRNTGVGFRNLKLANTMPGDGVVCNSCSLASRCNLFRDGAVCGVAGTDSEKLAKLMGSRDAEMLIDGLSFIAEIQAERVSADIDAERLEGKRSLDTDKRLKDLFDSGQKIAKLVDPSLNGKGVQVNVGVGIHGGAVGGGNTPQELVSSAIRSLESRGIPREDITQEAIIGLLEGVASRRGAETVDDVIDAKVIE